MVKRSCVLTNTMCSHKPRRECHAPPAPPAPSAPPVLQICETDWNLPPQSVSGRNRQVAAQMPSTASQHAPGT